MRVAFLRHGPTSWNAEKKIQGRTDIPLSSEGREQVSRYRLPPEYSKAPALVSPLTRARETAELVGAASLQTEPLLIEMDWGAWEGARLAELRDRYGVEMKENEYRGRDFRPEGGESPREVQERLQRLFARLCAEETGEDGLILAVTHKGVIRAAMALAYDWDMLGKPPVRLDWAALHVVRLAPGGAVLPEEMNVSLLP